MVAQSQRYVAPLQRRGISRVGRIAIWIAEFARSFYTTRAEYIITRAQGLRPIAYDIAEKPIRIINICQYVNVISILLRTVAHLIRPVRDLTHGDPCGVIMVRLEVYQYCEQPRLTEGPPPRIPFQRIEELLAYMGIYSRREARVFCTYGVYASQYFARLRFLWCRLSIM